MRVLVLGSGVIGTSVAYYLARSGHEVTVVDRQPGAGAGDELRQRRRGLARLFGAVGRAGRAAEGDQVAADAAPPAGHQADARPGDVALGPADAAPTAPRRAYRVNKGRMVRLAEYSRDCLRELRAETGIRYDERAQGTLQLFRTQKQLDGIGKDIEILQQSGVPFELLDRAGFVKVRARPRERRSTSSSARCGCRATRPATASSSRSGSHRWRRIWARRSASASTSSGSRTSGERITGVHTDAGLLTADQLRAGARQLFDAHARAARPAHAGLSGQGLLDHGADHRRRRARPSRRSWTRRTRSPSPGSATASASAARRSCRAST